MKILYKLLWAFEVQYLSDKDEKPSYFVHKGYKFLHILHVQYLHRHTTQIPSWLTFNFIVIVLVTIWMIVSDFIVCMIINYNVRVLHHELHHLYLQWLVLYSYNNEVTHLKRNLESSISRAYPAIANTSVKDVWLK